ncbi:glycosyltransferase family 2 protein [Carboxylicivirga sp. RSCT41]|uniref:glycosyltransferase family 2 protein n=1 Tax=Carboxylicivirga agarovorans TaxID=3417570 RepID=UPI003D335DA0
MIDTSVSVIISSYNHPKWLEKVLIGFSCQSVSGFEIVIADDGSGAETKSVVEKCRTNLDLNILYVWHEDKGFRKTKILNEALKISTGEYIIFTDGDCIPRRDFIETHLSNAEDGYYLSGGYVRLPLSVSRLIGFEDIASGRAFSIRWLQKAGVKRSFKLSKLSGFKWFTQMMNLITPANATWNGCNASTWREYFFELNGFNEDMHYGAEDREFGSRLDNKGLRSKQIRYSAICIHLDHARAYKNKEHLIANQTIWRTTKRNKLIVTKNGIQKL